MGYLVVIIALSSDNQIPDGLKSEEYILDLLRGIVVIGFVDSLEQGFDILARLLILQCINCMEESQIAHIQIWALRGLTDEVYFEIRIGIKCRLQFLIIIIEVRWSIVLLNENACYLTIAPPRELLNQCREEVVNEHPPRLIPVDTFWFPNKHSSWTEVG